MASALKFCMWKASFAMTVIRELSSPLSELCMTLGGTHAVLINDTNAAKIVFVLILESPGDADSKRR
jgi:hypothetical protein